MTNGINVISPEISPEIEGVGQDVWGDRWWQWNLPLPADKNPANFDDESDPRGRRGSLEKAQEAQDDDVFYLAASFSTGGPFLGPNRTIILPDDQAKKPIFFPVVNVNWRYGENGELGELEQIGEGFDPPITYPENAEPLTPEEIRRINTAIMDAVRDAEFDLPDDVPDQGRVPVPPYLILNGKSVTDGFPENFRQFSPDDSDGDGKPGFSFVLDGDVDESVAVGEGYWVGLEPLPPGDHKIQFGGVFDFDEIEIDVDGDGDVSTDPSFVEGSVNTVLRNFGELPLDVNYNVLNQIIGTNKGEEIPGTDLDDYIAGNNGKDTLTGGDGDDLILGGGGDDLIDGGSGSDELWGDEGEDKFIYRSGYGEDTIFDFSEEEIVELRGFEEFDDDDFEDLIQDITLPSGVNAAEINFGNGDVLKIVGVRADDLEIDDGKITFDD